MKEHYESLVSMLGYPPSFNLCSGYSALNSMLNKYLNVLNYFNSYNDDYKGATTLYYMDISNIRDHIQQSAYATSPEEKAAAFRKARKELTANIQALATLIQIHETLHEATT